MPIEFSTSESARVRVRFSYVAELLFAAEFMSGGLLVRAGIDEDWRERQRALLPERARAYLDLVSGFSCPILSLLDYVTFTGELDDADAFFSRVAAEPIDRFLYVLLNGDLGQETVAACLADPAGAAAETGKLSTFSRMGADDLVALFAEPERFRTELLQYVSANRTEAFDRKIAELKGRYDDRCRAVEARLARKHPIEVAEEFKKRVFERREYRDYLFVPSWFIGRLNITSAVGDSFLFAFNIDPETEGDNREGDAIAAGLRVVADRSRLEILRLLASGPSYGKEIASRLSLTTATVSRHLDQLKAAGLVTEEKADNQNVKLVRLNAEGVEVLLETARHFVCGSRPASR